VELQTGSKGSLMVLTIDTEIGAALKQETEEGAAEYIPWQLRLVNICQSRFTGATAIPARRRGAHFFSRTLDIASRRSGLSFKILYEDGHSYLPALDALT
jgi:hypothetical protein